LRHPRSNSAASAPKPLLAKSRNAAGLLQTGNPTGSAGRFAALDFYLSKYGFIFYAPTCEEQTVFFIRSFQHSYFNIQK
jgi:hypothetical protein